MGELWAAATGSEDGNASEWRRGLVCEIKDGDDASREKEEENLI